MPYYTEQLQSVLQLKDDAALSRYKQELEQRFADYTAINHAYLVESGTTAIQLALQLAGVGPGDEVIMPCANYPSSVLSVIYLQAKPVFVDIKEDATIDENKIEEKITPKTKAILPVHLFGHACRMERIMTIAENHNLKIIEDACQAHGSRYEGIRLGSLGHINAFSFTYHKTLGTIGGGGAITFNDKEFKQELDNALIVEKDNQNIIKSQRAPGKMSLADQVLLKIKLSIADSLEKDKRKNQIHYLQSLNEIKGITAFPDKRGESSVRQSMFILAEKRDQLKSFLEEHGIITKLPYRSAITMNIFKPFITSEFPNTKLYQENGLILPLFSFMTNEEINTITEKISQFLK